MTTATTTTSHRRFLSYDAAAASALQALGQQQQQQQQKEEQQHEQQQQQQLKEEQDYQKENTNAVKDNNNSNNNNNNNMNNRYHREIWDGYLDIPNMDGELWGNVEDSFIIGKNNTPPLRALELLERFQTELSFQSQCQLLGQVTRSPNPKVLTRAEKIMNDMIMTTTSQQQQNNKNDDDQQIRWMLLRFVITGWAKVDPQKAYQLLQQNQSLMQHYGGWSMHRFILSHCSKKNNNDKSSSKNARNIKSNNDHVGLVTRILRDLLSMEQPQQLLSLDRDLFHRALRVCAEAHDSSSAEYILEQMIHYSQSNPSNDCEPNKTTYRTLLMSYYSAPKHPKQQQQQQQYPAQKAKRAFQLWQSIPSSSDDNDEQEDVMLYNIMLNILAEGGKSCLDEAQSVFVQALERNAADTITFHTFLKTFAQVKTRDSAEMAQSWVQSIMMTHENTTKIITIPKPLSLSNYQHLVDARAYTTVMAMWCQLEHPTRAITLLEELQDLYQQEKQQQQQPQQLEGRRRSTNTHAMTTTTRFQPDPICYRSIIGSISTILSSSSNSNNKKQPHRRNRQKRGLAQQAQNVLDDMVRVVGYTPNLITCNTVLKCWSIVQCPDRAESLLKTMQDEWDITPDIVSFNTVLQAHVQAGHVHQAEALLEHLVTMHQQENNDNSNQLPTPNTRTVTSLLSALAKQCQTNPEAAIQAEEWLLRMQEWHDTYGWDTKPNRITYNVILNAWAVQGNGPRAEYVLKEIMMSSSSLSSIPKGHRHDRGEHDDVVVDDDEGDDDERPNVTSYNTVMNAYSHDYTKGLELLREMIRQGITPNTATYGTLRKVLKQDESILSSDKPKLIQELQNQHFSHLNPMDMDPHPHHHRRHKNNNSQKQRRGRWDGQHQNSDNGPRQQEP